MYLIRFTPLLATLLFCGACTGPSGRENKSTIPSTNSGSVKDSSQTTVTHEDDYDFGRNDTLPLGDVNGDGRNDTAILLNHVPQNDADSQYVDITFTTPMPSIRHASGFHGIMANAGDLDGNGTEEILYYPDWYQSVWAGLYVYGYRNGKWVKFGSGTVNRNFVWEAQDPIRFLQSRVQKINNRQFRFVEHVIDEETADVVEKTNTISIPR